MTQWTNWGRCASAQPTEVLRPTSIAGVCDVVTRATAAGRLVKVVGSGHSFTSIAVAPDIQMDLGALAGLIGGLILQIALAAALPDAIGRGEITVLFQPKIDVATRRPIGAEALVRWTHPELGPVSPPDIVELADELRVPITEVSRGRLDSIRVIGDGFDDKIGRQSIDRLTMKRINHDIIASGETLQ